MWLGHDTDHSPPSNAKVKKEYVLLLLSPQAPPWQVAGQIYLLLSISALVQTMDNKHYSIGIGDSNPHIIEMPAGFYL
jgi:hypothetical protein